ncbi:hypothetical protein [Asanoa siamensis]|nr:hypothetical protein [Asanoa siamensis]
MAFEVNTTNLPSALTAGVEVEVPESPCSPAEETLTRCVTPRSRTKMSRA